MDRVSFLPMDHAPPAPASVLSPETILASVAEVLGRQEATLTANGRAALTAVLRHIRLRPEHEVFVSTTFGYANVSACVTSTIFNFCKPSRVLGAATRAILVIHEFGVPHAETPALRHDANLRGIPLIEDCAHGIASRAVDGWRIGELGDWSIVSLPKLLPAGSGGLLVGPHVPYAPSPRETREMWAAADLASAWWPSWAEQMQRRRHVYRLLTRESLRIGLKPLFEVNDNLCPWFFPVQVAYPDAVQQVAHEQGVDCGIWHGSEVVIFPCHQFLNDDHVNRIAAVLVRAVDPDLIAERRLGA